MFQDSTFDLNDYAYFFHVVEQRGFAPAGRALGIPKSRISRHIQQLETRLDARLIQRTSRQFAITNAGIEFFRHAKVIMEEVQTAEVAIKQRSDALTGKIRISCSPGLANFALHSLVSEFLRQHPKVEIGQFVTNEMVNLIDSGVDLVIRGHVDNLPDSSLIQKQVVKVQWGLFGSPRYIEEVGEFVTPDDLKGCRGLGLGWRNDVGQWNLHSKQANSKVIQYIPRLSSDDMITLKEACAAGLGVVSLPAYVCENDVKIGRLVEILPDWCSGEATLSLLQPSRQGTPPAVSAFAEHISRKLSQLITSR
ncbi:MAG: LysR substrate-binding domain-containing protein [Litorimonas sp.]